MQKTLVNSDLVIKVQFKDTSGVPIEVPQNFKLLYTTLGTQKPLEASFDGVEFVNCKKIDQTTILATFDNPRLNVGQMRCVRTYSVHSEHFSDKKRDFKQSELLPIMVVQSYGDDYEGISSNDIIDSVYLEVGPKGPAGPKGDSSAIDYSSNKETLIQGEFWIGRDGTKKPVFYQTIVTQATIISDSNLGIIAKLWDKVMDIDTIFDYCGCYEVDSSTFNLSEPAFTTTLQHFNGRLQILSHCVPAYLGKTLKAKLMIKYTKM